METELFGYYELLIITGIYLHVPLRFGYFKATVNTDRRDESACQLVICHILS